MSTYQNLIDEARNFCRIYKLPSQEPTMERMIERFIDRLDKAYLHRKISLAEYEEIYQLLDF